MADFLPTDEQVAARDLAMAGGHLVIEALAGTGKTSTSVLIAEGMNKRARVRGLYVAFNKAIVTDAQAKFPRQRFACRTAHSLAMQSVGRAYAHRLGQPRMKSREIARRCGIEPLVVQTPFGPKRLEPGFLAGVMMKGLRKFATTDDDEPCFDHIPTPDTIRDDDEMKSAWDGIRVALEPQLRKAWEDVTNTEGLLPYEQGYYLKQWTLTRPQLNADYLLLDEAQDLNGCMLTIPAANRDRLQVIATGDRYQQIYTWNGSVNALSKIESDNHAWLTHSFRFGPQIADQANEVLGCLAAPVRLVGRGQPGRVETLDYPDVLLTRTNAWAVKAALTELADGGRPCIVGGAASVISFAQGALDLQEGRPSTNMELVCFSSWEDVHAYVADDEMGSDLKLLVDLVEEFGADAIVQQLHTMPEETKASLIISTAHKAKGREWHTVQLGGDFPETVEQVADEELRLLYVAATRARFQLDPFAVGLLREIGTGAYALQ